MVEPFFSLANPFAPLQTYTQSCNSLTYLAYYRVLVGVATIAVGIARTAEPLGTRRAPLKQ